MLLPAILLGGLLAALPPGLDPALFPGADARPPDEVALAGLSVLYPGHILREAPHAADPSAAGRPALAAELPHNTIYLRVYDLNAALSRIAEVLPRSNVILDFRFLAPSAAAAEALEGTLTRAGLASEPLKTLGAPPPAAAPLPAPGGRGGPPSFSPGGRSGPTSFGNGLRGGPSAATGPRGLLSNQSGPSGSGSSVLPTVSRFTHPPAAPPVLVLINGETSGPVEAVLAAFQAKESLLTVGTPTAGEPGLYEPAMGEPAYYILTTEWLPASGSVAGTGLQPRFPVDVSSPENFRAYMDVERGTDIVSLLRRDRPSAPAPTGNQTSSTAPAAMPVPPSDEGIDPVLQRAVDVVAALQLLHPVASSPTPLPPTKPAPEPAPSNRP